MSPLLNRSLSDKTELNKFPRKVLFFMRIIKFGALPGLGRLMFRQIELVCY